MSFTNLSILQAAKTEFFRKEQELLDQEARELTRLDRSPSDKVASGTASEMSDSLKRKLDGQPVAGVAKSGFLDKFKKLLNLNLNDAVDGSMLNLSALDGQVFSGLMSITGFDGNRGLFDLVQRGAERLQERVGLQLGALNDVIGTATELATQIQSVVDSQGDWFSNDGDGFRKNVERAVPKVRSVLDKVRELRSQIDDSSRLPRQQDLDSVKDLLAGVREELVPLNADLRPESGIDHPRASELVAVTQLRRLREDLSAKFDRVKKTHDKIARQKQGLPKTFDNENVRSRGETVRREFSRMFARFEEILDEVQATTSHAAGSGGVGQVFNSQEDWVAGIESMQTLLDKNLLVFGTQEEDGGGAYDIQTDAMVAHFDTFKSGLESVTDVDIGVMEGHVQKLLDLASASLGGTGLTSADVSGILGDLSSEKLNVDTFIIGIQDAMQNGGFDFFDGTIPKLDRITAFKDIIEGGGLDSTVDFFESGILFDEGAFSLDVRSVDSIGRFAQQLRSVAQGGGEGDEISNVSKRRAEVVNAALDKDQRRRAREAQTKGKIIEDAKADLAFRQARLEELKREAEILEQELS